MNKLIPLFALSGILILSSIYPVYADVISWELFKDQNFEQTANNVQPTTPSELSFFVGLFTSDQSDFDFVDLIGTPAGTIALTQDGSDWFFFDSVSSKTVLDTKYPNQAYTFSTSGGTLGIFNEVGDLSVSPERYSDEVPYLTGNSFDDLQGMDPTQDITITWNLPSSGGSQVTDVFLGIGEVSIAGPGTVFNSQFDVSTVSTVIPANTLNPDTSYFLALIYGANLEDTKDSFLTGAGNTSFELVTEVLFDTSSASPTPVSKVTICHKPGTPAEHTKDVPENAVPGHLGHGDFIGTCEDLLQPGDIIVADIIANAIIKVNPNTGAQTIISSGGLFAGALDLWLDSNGDIIVADLDFSGGGSIIKVDTISGIQTVISTGVTFVTPNGVVVAANGDIFVADFDDVNVGPGRITKVDPITGTQTVFSTGGLLVNPAGITLDTNGDIIITDFNSITPSNNIIRIDRVTGAQTIISSGGFFENIIDLTFDANGDILVADVSLIGVPGTGSIIKVDPISGAQTVISTGGIFAGPNGVAVDANGDIIVTDFGTGVTDTGSIIKVDPISGAQTLISTGGTFVTPAGIFIVQ